MSARVLSMRHFARPGGHVPGVETVTCPECGHDLDVNEFGEIEMHDASDCETLRRAFDEEEDAHDELACPECEGHHDPDEECCSYDED